MSNARIIPLWPDGSPHNPTDPAERPRIEIHAPGEPLGRPCPAVLVFPGGGYVTRAPHEADPFAAFFAEHGYVGIVCHYRVKPHYYPAPMADAARAIRMVRSIAPEHDIDADRLAILGFSAGGHLVCTMASQPDLVRVPEDDLSDRFSGRPNRLMAAYPAVSLVKHNRNLAPNLLGDAVQADDRAQLSSELHVTPDHPPTFLFHTTDDPVVPAEQSVDYALALKAAGVPVELHLYASGPHGVGMAQDRPSLRSWPGLMVDWLAAQS